MRKGSFKHCNPLVCAVYIMYPHQLLEKVIPDHPWLNKVLSVSLGS